MASLLILLTCLHCSKTQDSATTLKTKKHWIKDNFIQLEPPFQGSLLLPL